MNIDGYEYEYELSRYEYSVNLVPSVSISLESSSAVFCIVKYSLDWQVLGTRVRVYLSLSRY